MAAPGTFVVIFRTRVNDTGDSLAETEAARWPSDSPVLSRVPFSPRDLLYSGAIALVLAAQAAWFAVSTSGTSDETTYLRNGVSIFRHGDFSGLPGDGIAPLPVLLSMAAPMTLETDGYADAIRIARGSAIALFGIPLALLVYATLHGACGRAAAATGALLIALSPNVIAHAGLATTDVCFVLAALIALGALAWYVEERTRARLVWLSVSLSLALAAKYSGVALFAATAIVLFITDRERRGVGRIAHAVQVTCALGAVAVVVVWALHAFTFAPPTSRRLGSEPLPAAIVGILTQAKHQRTGHQAFLMGDRSLFGWWYYMPVALAVKSTPVELLIMAYGLWVCATGWRRLSPRALVWRVALLTFVVFALTNRVALGVRYILPVLPLFIFIALDGWHRRSGRPPRWARIAGVALVMAQAVSAISIAPHYLAYFNRMAGGPEAGHLYLADSNIDWGQDLPALRETLARVGARRPLVSYFGTAPLEEYGVFADRWDGSVRDDLARWDWVAVSVTHLNGLYVPRDIFRPFRSIPPSARAGYSILLYDTGRPEVRAAMASAAARWPADE